MHVGRDPHQEVARFAVWLYDQVPYGGKRKHDTASLRGVTIAGYISAARKQLELRTDERLIYTTKSRELLRRLKALPAPVRFKEPIPLEVVLALLNDTDLSIGIRAAVALAWFLTLRLGESMLSQLTEVYNSARTTQRGDVDFVTDAGGVVALRHGAPKTTRTTRAVSRFCARRRSRGQYAQWLSSCQWSTGRSH